MITRRSLCVYLFILLFIFSTICAWSAVPSLSAQVTKVVAPLVNGDPIAVLQNGLTRIGATTDMKTRAVQQFKSLPVDLQSSVLEWVTSGPVPKRIVNIDKDKLEDAVIAGKSPAITEIYPEKAGYDNWVWIKGERFTQNCVVQWDGVAVPSQPYADRLWFKVSATDIGNYHKISVYDKSTALASLPVNFRVISPLTYRSKWGWQFKNFSTYDLSYNLFRDYFTPAQVEYSPGKPYASALNWYNSTYKSIARNGDCFGMSVRSIKTRLKDYSGTWSSWLSSNVENYIWNYPWIDPQRADGIREDQGAQLCREAAFLIDDRWHNQTHSDAVKMIYSALGSNDVSKLPVLCMWVNGGYSGHAVVCYGAMVEIGVKHHLYCYDNNKPYSELEKNSDESTAYVNANGTFSYSYWPGTTANRMICLLYNEIAVPLPHLPSDATNTTGMGADTTIAVFDNQNAVQQITDEAGHVFYANGVENSNASSRIPESMRFIPMTGGPQPADAPAIYIFNKSTGKSLTFDTAGSASGNARIFSAGSVTSMNLSRGRFTIKNIRQPAQELNLISPDQMQLQNVEIISVQPDRSERVFRMNNFKNLVPGTLKFALTPERNAISASGVPAQFGLSIKGQSTAGLRTASMPNVALQANRITSVKVSDFRTLQNSSLQMESR